MHCTCDAASPYSSANTWYGEGQSLAVPRTPFLARARQKLGVATRPSSVGRFAVLLIRCRFALVILALFMSRIVLRPVCGRIDFYAAAEQQCRVG